MKKILKTGKTGKIVDRRLWRQRVNTSKLPFRGAKIDFERNTSIVESITNATNIAVGENGNEDSQFETLNLFQKVYSLRIYCDFLGYIVDKVEAKLVQGTTLSLASLDAWTITVVQCFAEQEFRGGQCQKLYTDASGSNLELALAQIVE